MINQPETGDTETIPMPREIDWNRRPIIGMVHLSPLPGSYRYTDSMEEILDRARRDATSLATGGVDGVLVENFGDAPYRKRAEPITIAAMARAVNEVVATVDLPVGVNVLRNDGVAALAVAAIAQASFIRVNIWSGVAFTDQGVIEGCAAEVLELKHRLASQVAVLADVHVKHAAHFDRLEAAVQDAERNLPDALIVTGPGTGTAADVEALHGVRRIATLPILVGSGITTENLGAYREADGFIVGTALKLEGHVNNEVDPARVERLMKERDRVFSK
ncbi:MAG: BtpA/SgcQ family protein [Candidatus Bipolaricaulia bacterium]